MKKKQKRKLSYREALTRCIKMWQWLADNPGRSKTQYFGRRRYKPSNIPDSDCYFCEYDSQKASGPACSTCPGNGALWSTGRCDTHCTYNGPYYDWITSSHYDDWEARKRRAALRMVKGCKKLLKEYDKAQGKPKKRG